MDASPKRGKSNVPLGWSPFPLPFFPLFLHSFPRLTFRVLCPAGPPRSEMEALLFLHGDSGNKFRQLPCRTFISVGSCPYRERCVYLHDPRLLCPDAKSKSRVRDCKSLATSTFSPHTHTSPLTLHTSSLHRLRERLQKTNKEDLVLDAYFWPCLQAEQVNRYLDASKQPTVTQEYSVPPPKNDVYRGHDAATYSMWMHFCDLCEASQGSGRERARRDYRETMDCSASINTYTKERRLEVFRTLAYGEDVVDSKSSLQPMELTAPTLIKAAREVSSVDKDVTGTRQASSAPFRASAIISLPSSSNIPMSLSTPRIHGTHVSSRAEYAHAATAHPMQPAPSVVHQPQSWESASNHQSTKLARPASSRIHAFGALRAPNLDSAADHVLLEDLPAHLSFLNSPTRLAQSRIVRLFLENQCVTKPERFDSCGRDLLSIPCMPPATGPHATISLATTEETTSTTEVSSISMTTSGESCGPTSGFEVPCVSFNPYAPSFVPSGRISGLTSTRIMTTSLSHPGN